ENGATFTQASEQDIDHLRGVASNLQDAWSESVKSRDVDAPAALAFFHEQLVNAAAEESIAGSVVSH
ncbi:hypothetical protein LC162_24665, partial [Escherichia coli]